MENTLSILVGWTGEMQWADADEEARADKVLGKVMEYLLACDGWEDPTIDLDGPNTVTFSAILKGTDETDALTRFSFLLRSCLHAAGVGTPAWQTTDELVREYRRSFTAGQGGHTTELLGV